MSEQTEPRKSRKRPPTAEEVKAYQRQVAELGETPLQRELTSIAQCIGELQERIEALESDAKQRADWAGCINHAISGLSSRVGAAEASFGAEHARSERIERFTAAALTGLLSANRDVTFPKDAEDAVYVGIETNGEFEKWQAEMEKGDG